MLNEIREADGYLFDPDAGACEYQSLNTKLFCGKKGDLNGLDRAMTMVARYFLFEDGADEEQAIARAKVALMMWCGLMPENLKGALAEEHLYLMVKYPWIDHWLPELLKRESAMDSGPNSAIVEKALTKLEKRRDQFTYGALTYANANNNFKLLSYEKVIANALIARGPLKKYYLVCNDADWFSKVCKKKRGEEYANPMGKDEDKVAKLIAAYLLETNRKKKRTVSAGFEPVSLNDVSAWIGMKTKLTNTNFAVFSYQKQALFEFEMGRSGNMIKVRPNADWFEHCGWALIDATEGDAALDEWLADHPGAVFYSDHGMAARLERGVRYH